MRCMLVQHCGLCPGKWAVEGCLSAAIEQTKHFNIQAFLSIIFMDTLTWAMSRAHACCQVLKKNLRASEIHAERQLAAVKHHPCTGAYSTSQW